MRSVLAALIIFCSLPSSFAYHIVNVQGAGNREFIKFYTSQYLEWADKRTGFLSGATTYEKNFVTAALSSYDSWGKVNKPFLTPYFNFIYEHRADTISQGIYLFLNEEIKASQAFKDLIKKSKIHASFDQVEAVEIWPKERTLKLYTEQDEIKVFRSGELIETYKVKGPYLHKFHFLKWFKGPHRVFYQSSKKSTKKVCYLSTIKAIPLLSLPKPALILVSGHKKEQSLSIRNVEECDDGTFRILYP